MSYRVIGLDPAEFSHLFNLPDAALAAQGLSGMSLMQSPASRIALVTGHGNR
jgi:hypothetical protein